jgi:2-oxo-4-hydroxy-4-carboxy-5-ureidoimidazoline decarboxylase
MTLDEFNKLPAENLTEDLIQCCGAVNWVKGLLAHRPYTSLISLKEQSSIIWNGLSKEEWLIVFSQHPKIGEAPQKLESNDKHLKMAADEQSTTETAKASELQALASFNRRYYHKFGYIFIISATGKTTEEMLTSLKQRLNNSADEEILIAANEQNQITNIRLSKLIK